MAVALLDMRLLSVGRRAPHLGSGADAGPATRGSPGAGALQAKATEDPSIIGGAGTPTPAAEAPADEETADAEVEAPVAEADAPTAEADTADTADTADSTSETSEPTA